MAQGIKNPLYFGIPLRLKRARKARGISMAAVATQAGLSFGTARRIEVEGGAPRLDVVEALARVLDVRPAWLAWGLGEQAAAAAISTATAQVGERLRAAREAAGVTRAALGKAAALTGQAVAHVEEGRSVPSVATVEALADALAVSPAWLGFGEE